MANRLDVTNAHSRDAAVIRAGANAKGAARGVLIFLFCCAGFAAPSQAKGADAHGINFELTGTVLDISTKRPIEGAYVIATYYEVFSGLGASGIRCVKSKGMYTGIDGRFHFPVEKRDGYSPMSVAAIKSDYQYAPAAPVDRNVWLKQNAASYADRILYVTAQDPAKPDFHFGVGRETCDQATTREAAAASLEFAKIELKEKIKYKALQQNIDGARDTIEMFESLPSEGEGKSKNR